MMKKGVVFSPKQYQLVNIIKDIETGDIALPDLQRPFVWKLSKVRDLLDSMYKGLPIGSIILWEIKEPKSFKPIGVEIKQRTPRYLVIDGQQRLTSLFSIINDKEVISENVKKIKIKIAFNPIEEKFEVSNPAIEKSPEWIPDISILFKGGSAYDLINQYLNKNKKSIDEKGLDNGKIAARIETIRDILSYPLSVIELSNDLDPEKVSEIFVRINSKGKTLSQSDFILTLMSVYWPEGRERLETFCKDSHTKPEGKKISSYNLLNIKPKPENIIRTVVAFSFNRGKLKYAFLALKGRDFENKVISEELREKNFAIFKDGQNKALDLSNWHDFIKIIHSAGFVNENMITSKIALYITYAFYLLGKYKCKMEYKKLESLIKKWFVFLQLTARYTKSPETVIEEDLKNLEEKNNFEEFINSRIKTHLTEDFWKITLPNALESSSTTNYAFQVYNAALVYSDVNVLFSDTKLRDYLNPLFKSKKKTLELHHIFPKKYLEKFGYKKKQINQVANLIYIEYKDNISIKDKPPSEYWQKFLEMTEKNEAEIYEKYDLPSGFYNMNYMDFLSQRRKLMSAKIKTYFERL